MDTSITNIAKAPAHLSKSGPAWRLPIAGLFVVIALGAFFAGRLARQKTSDQLNAAAELRTASPILMNGPKSRRAPSSRDKTLPGTTLPITATHVFLHAP